MLRGWLLAAAAFVCAPAFGADVKAARYIEPTDAYGHGAVEGGEYAALEVALDTGQTQTLRLRQSVFEDTALRLNDLDNDGRAEIVTVISSFQAGARVQIFSLRDGAIVPTASNAPIGQRNRWLAIAGIADFDGDGLKDIAYVDRPHLAKTLRILRTQPNGHLKGRQMYRFDELASAQGFTNHHYGSPVIEGGVRECAEDAPVIVTANANWTRVIETRWSREAQKLVSQEVGPYLDAKDLASYLSCH